ncbi:LytTR family DNA-binding domain-containing protein [Dyadobacter sp. CY261]|uniref:LytR/AlgR family response regulator transcription factor n=1 Tax=Dyadobacter sp. CY261 TaxID=2907203 RepID=UPI001F1F1C36|nr:LytTR family DNA-binding domain-containing protein [Dyadobacter sp. CY261]MCF0071222.1 LytTR family DNA-binding domain-containing protein [Dyadobacter sp. CY261]
MLSPGRLRCIIVDDEADARRLIEIYVQKVPYLELVGFAENATDALFMIRDIKPDIVFLDIEMPEMTGFELLKLLPAARPAVIMITADPSYALEGYEHELTDYLLKPVPFERFLKAVNKVDSAHLPKHLQGASEPRREFVQPAGESHEADDVNTFTGALNDFLLLKENKKLIKVAPSEIHFIEGMRDYLKLYWADRVAVIHMTMSKIEEVLSPTQFLRVNRSYIVNKKVIREIEGNEITTNTGRKIPIGVTYRANVLAALQKNRI